MDYLTFLGSHFFGLKGGYGPVAKSFATGPFFVQSSPTGQTQLTHGLRGLCVGEVWVSSGLSVRYFEPCFNDSQFFLQRKTPAFLGSGAWKII